MYVLKFEAFLHCRILIWLTPDLSVVDLNNTWPIAIFQTTFPLRSQQGIRFCKAVFQSSQPPSNPSRLHKMPSFSRLAATCLLIIAAVLLFMGQTVEAGRGPKITNKVSQIRCITKELALTDRGLLRCPTRRGKIGTYRYRPLRQDCP